MLVAVPAHAAPGDATRLSYSRARAAAACPDREALRTAVSKRLGYDPFFPVARQAIEVDIAAEGDMLTASMRFVNDAGIIVGSRKLSERPDHCAELVTSLALAISITLDPSAAFEDPVAPVQREVDQVEDAPEVTAAPVLVEAPPMAEPPSDRLPEPRRRPAPRLGFRAAPVLAIGRLPNVAVGASVAVGARAGIAQGFLEVSGFAAASRASNQGGSVEASLISAALVPCASFARWSACGVGALGRLSAEGRDVDAGKRERRLYAAVGVRMEVKQAVGEHLTVFLGVDALKTFTPLTFRLHGVPVWQTAWGSFGAALGVELHFL
jgi:hypothetical protein